MLRKEKDGIPFFEFALFQEFRGGLRHAVFTRQTNIDDIAEIQKVLQTSAPPLSFKNQLHGTKIIIVEKNRPENKVAPFGRVNKGSRLCRRHDAEASLLRLGLGDVLMTSKSEIPLFIRIADCASIMIFDPEKKVIANIHAGWRGLAAKIIHKTIDRLCAQFNSQRKNLLAAISPMIGPCCCRFSDPYKELPSHFHRFIAKEKKVAPFGRVNEVASLPACPVGRRLGLKVDLWAAAEGHLRECGILAAHIENPRMCTACHPEDFYSYRREGEKGRFGTAIMLC